MSEQDDNGAAAYDVAISVVTYMNRRCEKKEVALSTVMAQVMGSLQAMVQVNMPYWVEQMRKSNSMLAHHSDEVLAEALNNRLEAIRQAAIRAGLDSVKAENDEPPVH